MPIFLGLAAANGSLITRAPQIETLLAEYGATVFDWTANTLCSFVEPVNALDCVLTLHAQAPVLGIMPGIALHAGPYERLGRRIIGAEINRAHHMARAARMGEVLMTQECVAAVPFPPEAKAHPLGKHMLTDLALPVTLYRLQHPSLEKQDFPPLNSLSHYPNNLRVQSTTFVGRKKEVEEIITRLRAPNTRLLSLTGPGGIGKTRLALQVAAEMMHDFQHGVFLISCEALASAAFLPSAIEEALNLPASGRMDPHTHLFNQLRRRSVLLVLDNYESLLPNTTLLKEIIQHTPQVKLLLTTRESLNLPEEQVFSLEGLSYPHNEVHEEINNFEAFDAVELFFLAALRADPLFAATENSCDAIITICEALEGLPLGLELAATAISVFSCHEIARKITQGLGFLEAKRRDLPPRHRSLHAAFELTWQPLAVSDKLAFARCAVFHDPFSAAAAQGIADVPLETLELLARKSMLTKMQGQLYKFHPLLHRFADEQLSLMPELTTSLQERHSQYFLTLLRDQSVKLRGRQQHTGAEALAGSLGDIRAAWIRALKCQNAVILREAAPALLRLYTVREQFRDGAALFSESVEILRTNLPRIPPLDPTCELALADCLLAEGTLTVAMAQNDRAQAQLEAAQEIYLKHDSQAEQAQVHLRFGNVAFNRGQYHLAQSYFQQARDLAVKTQSAICEHDATHYLGHTNIALGNNRAASENLDRSLALSETLDDWWLGMHTIRLRGNLYYATGKNELARSCYQRSVELANDYGSQQALSYALNNLAMLAMIASEYPLAQRYYEQALTIQRDSDNLRLLANTLHNLGVTVTDLGEPEYGLKLLDEALEIHGRNNNQDGKAFALLYRAYALEVLGNTSSAEAIYREALALFKASGNLGGTCNAYECLGFLLLSLDRNAEAEQLFQNALQLQQEGPGNIATTYRGMARAAAALGRCDEARGYFCRAVELALEAQWIGTLLHTFVEIANFYVQLGDIEKAVRIQFSVLRDARIVIPMQQQIRARIAALLPSLDAKTAKEIQHSDERLDVEIMARELISSLQNDQASIEDLEHAWRDAERKNADLGNQS
ncbi:MAG: tetratricopeptide repeat protein [Anaerolineae bacterium]|nr:tetratricopeptide repeat protein [Anaerolineae bacterium]